MESGGGCDGRQAHIKKAEGQSVQCVRNTGMPVWDCDTGFNRGTAAEAACMREQLGAANGRGVESRQEDGRTERGDGDADEPAERRMVEHRLKWAGHC